ncbi:MAG: hypothetical protein C4318_04090 [Acidimicrobiia bacterium]
MLAHWLPTGSWDEETDELYEGVADRLAKSCGIGVLAPRLRGVGASEGDFSISGWCRDIASAIDYVTSALSGGDTQVEVLGVGFGIGGSCLLSVAAGDMRVRGVAVAGSPSEFANSILSREGYIKRARSAGLIRSQSFPPDPHSWRRELIAYAPLHHARRLQNRPVLLVCREGDKLASPMEMERLAEVIGDSCEIHTLPRSAPSLLVKSDRVISVLEGWVKRNFDGVKKANAVV